MGWAQPREFPAQRGIYWVHHLHSQSSPWPIASVNSLVSSLTHTPTPIIFVQEMAEPLSIGAGVVGVIVPALHGSRLLLDGLRSIIDAPKVIETLREDVRSLEMALTSLQAVKDAEWELLGNVVVEQSKATINSCTKGCEMFHTKLQHWTKHSNGQKLSWQDRANVGFFKQRRIKALSDQLQTCQISINSVVGIATLWVPLYYIIIMMFYANCSSDTAQFALPISPKRSRRLSQQRRRRSLRPLHRLTYSWRK